jgi:hypothetical protein
VAWAAWACNRPVQASLPEKSPAAAGLFAFRGQPGKPPDFNASYYGFILLVAYNPTFLATKMGAGMTTSIGVPIGVGVIVFTIILTWIYVRRANSEFDDEAAEILKGARK